MHAPAKRTATTEWTNNALKHVLQCGKSHPLFVVLQKHIPRENLDTYRVNVNDYLVTLKSIGKLAEGVQIVLQYANFVQNAQLKTVLLTETHRFCPLVGLDVSTIVKREEQDTLDHTFKAYFAINSPLNSIVNKTLVFLLRNNIDKGKVHKSYVSVKSEARLTFFLEKKLEEDSEGNIPSDIFPILMNFSEKTFADVVAEWDNQTLSSTPANAWTENVSSTSSTSSPSSPPNLGTRPTSDSLKQLNSPNLRHFRELEISTIRVLIKKEKDIERFVFFQTGFDQEIRRLSTCIFESNKKSTESAHSAEKKQSPPGSRRPTPPSKKAILKWGKNHWMLNNYVDANFMCQKNSFKIFRSDTDGFHYVNLGLNSVLSDAQVLMKLELANTEYIYNFIGWITVSKDNTCSYLYGIVPKPEWEVRTLPKTIRVQFSPEAIFGNTKHRFRSALPRIAEPAQLEWFKKEANTQIQTFYADPSYAEQTRYNSKNSFGFVLPLYFDQKLVLTIVLEEKEIPSASSSSDNLQSDLTVVAVILPAWAYNNTRILGYPKTEWMKNYAENYSEEEEEIQKAQQLIMKEKGERQKFGEKQ